MEIEDHVEKGVQQVPEAEMVQMVPLVPLVPLAPLVLEGNLVLSILTKEFHLALDQWA